MISSQRRTVRPVRPRLPDLALRRLQLHGTEVVPIQSNH
jgi:hypothetical protein